MQSSLSSEQGDVPARQSDCLRNQWNQIELCKVCDLLCDLLFIVVLLLLPLVSFRSLNMQLSLLSPSALIIPDWPDVLHLPLLLLPCVFKLLSMFFVSLLFSAIHVFLFFLFGSVLFFIRILDQGCFIQF